MAAPRISAAGVRSGSTFTLPLLDSLNDAVYIAFGDTTGNRFANVRVIGVANWETAANIAGNVLVDSTGYLIGNGHVSIGDTMYVSYYGAVGVEATELFGVLADSSSEFDADTTIFSGTTQTMPSLYYNGAVVVNAPALSTIEDDWGAEIDGSLFIVGSGQVRIGGVVDSTCLGCEADLYVDAALETHNSGTVRMTDTTTSYLYLEVDDSAYFAGGSSTGLLTRGEIDFYGNFRQGGATATSFVATSPNEVYFDSYDLETVNGLPGQYVTFANPGYTASHLGDFYFEPGDYYLASNVFGDGSFNTGCIGCTLDHRLHTATPGSTVSITSKGADVADLEMDGVSWDLQDGYPVYSADSVDFLNQDSTKVQFSIERGNTIPMGPNNVFSNWIFETRPQFGVGLYVQATQTDDAEVNGPLTISFASPPQLFGNFGGISTSNGAQIPIWNLGGGGAELSASNWLSQRFRASGTSTSHAGTVTGGSYDPLRR